MGMIVGGQATAAPPSFTPDTFNPSDKMPYVNLSNGNLTVTQALSNLYGGVRNVQGKTTGKRHLEFYVNARVSDDIRCEVGIVVGAQELNTPMGSDIQGIIYRFDGYIRSNANSATPPIIGVTSQPHLDTGSTIAIAVDLDTRVIRFYTGGSWRGPFDISHLTGPLYAAAMGYTIGDQITVNFGASPFSVTRLTDYSAWDS